jgi:hypothetical protein
VSAKSVAAPKPLPAYLKGREERRRRLRERAGSRYAQATPRFVRAREVFALYLGAFMEEFPGELVDIRMIADVSGVSLRTCYRLLSQHTDALTSPPTKPPSL